MADCHGNTGVDTLFMSDNEQKSMAGMVALTLGTTAASGGMSLVYNSAKGIYYSYQLVNGARTLVAVSAARTGALTTSLTEAAIVSGSPIMMNPAVQQNVVDFTTSLFPGSPAMSPAGAAGGLLGGQFSPQDLLRK